jgi:hypothetical protein
VDPLFTYAQVVGTRKTVKGWSCCPSRPSISGAPGSRSPERAAPMARFVLRRLVALVPVALGASFAAFFLIHLIPGDPAEVIAGIGASGTDIERVRGQLGLDRPMLVQYALWLERALVGDLGM